MLTNYSKDRKLVYTRLIETYITENGGTHWVPEHISEPDDDGDQRYDLSDMPADIECVIVLGGDVAAVDNNGVLHNSQSQSCSA